MRPVRIEFQAFGPYAGHEAVDFEALSAQGLFLICGKTGIGKTMILDAMTFALYGKSSGHGRDDFASMRCTNADFDTTTFVKLEFEHNGEYYVFERRLERKRKNLSAAYNVMKKDSDGVYRVCLENAKEKTMNEMAVKMLGLEYDQFRQVIVLPQGQFEKLLTSNSEEKEKILTSIFGEEKWQRIADELYAQVVERKDRLKSKQERIAMSLMEEHCASMEELYRLISQKEAVLAELDENYKLADYDQIIRKQQEMLALIKRFGDLHKAEERILRLEDEKENQKTTAQRISDAKRADKVRNLMQTLDAARKAYEKRLQDEESSIQTAEALEEAMKTAEEALQNHLEKEDKIEQKKALRIQYEGKRSDYEGIDAIQKELRDCQKEIEQAKTEEQTAKKIYDRQAERIIQLQGEYAALNEKHSRLLDSYLAGITGELAQELHEGIPCPVCGSTEHPDKAKSADNSITKAMVDEQKSEADTKYQELQGMLTKQDEAKEILDEKHTAVGKIHTRMIACETMLESMKNNLVEGVNSLEELNGVLKELQQEIETYSVKRTELERDEKKKKETCTEAKARIESARMETASSKTLLQTAETALCAGLTEHRFETEDEAKELLLSENEIEKLTKQMADYEANVKAARESLGALQEELMNQEEPDETVCKEQLNAASNAKSEYAEQKGILTTELRRLKEKAKMLENEGSGIEEQLLRAEEDFVFAKKLRGDSGTGLQRYVLGIMFSSVVAAANKMLEMVHGGRYRLYRSDEKVQGSNKRGLELKVYDRNSEEHEGRFVSTLSGGEKFLASLALSIGMSTVAQKSGMKIEALFIDEGFGSLDEDSISDAMNILDSIQKANGLVGIISHVQILQDRIPTKLRVEEIDKSSHIVQTIG